MNDREKLVELVCEVIQTEACNRHCNHPPCDMASDIADQLLSHGVTIREPGEWKHGRKNGEYGIWCSKCGTGWTESPNCEVIAACHNFCPNCGAPMKGESK